MIHCVEELVFIDEAADGEVDETEETDEPGAGEDTIDDADDENEDVWRESETVAETWRVGHVGKVAGSFGT